MLFTPASQVLQTSAQMLTRLAPIRTSSVLEGVEEQTPLFGGRAIFSMVVFKTLAKLE